MHTLAVTSNEAAIAISVVVMLGIVLAVIAWQILAIARDRSSDR